MPFNSLKSLNTINFKEMLIVALNKWYLLLISLVMAALFSFAYTGLIAEPKYDSTGEIYIGDQDKMDEITTTELSTSTYLVYDYQNLIRDQAVLNDVAKKMNFKYSYSYLSRAITVNNPEYTRFIEITVRTPYPKDSQKIVNLLIEISKEKAKKLLNLDQINVIRYGTITTKPSSPDKLHHLRMSLLVGLIVFILFVAGIYVFDDKVKDADSVQNDLGMTLLGSIPYSATRAAKNTKAT